MEISGLGSAFPFLFQGNDKNGEMINAKDSGDVVEINSPYIIPDEEVEGVFNETLGMIASDNTAALSVHSGLSESRVFALLGY